MGHLSRINHYVARCESADQNRGGDDTRDPGVMGSQIDRFCERGLPRNRLPQLFVVSKTLRFFDLAAAGQKKTSQRQGGEEPLKEHSSFHRL